MERFCIYPFSQMQIATSGNVYTCCKSWIGGLAIGNIYKSDFFDIWNSDTAKALRESIHDRSFRYCNRNVCHAIISGTVDRWENIPGKFKDISVNKQCRLETGPEVIALNYDNSCNLHCKSCRDSVKIMNKENIQRLIKFQDLLISSALFKGVQRIVISGSGEVFASSVYMNFLMKMDETKNPHLRITLRTNGLLLTPIYWQKIEKAHYAIDEISISIDAATEKTYQKLREGGDFNQLIDNLEYLKVVNKNKKMKIRLNFVVQESNFDEMPNFLKLAQRFDVDQVAFSQLSNRGTYSKEEYERMAVHRPAHPRFKELKNIIRKSVFNNKNVYFTNLSHLLRD